MSRESFMVGSTSPNGNVEAVVEQGEDVVHFYIRSLENRFPMRACWVRNLVEAPEDLDVESLEEGRAPLLPRAFCQHPEGAPGLDQEAIDIVWFEEGDAAALLEGGRILVIIPCWSGTGGFRGYAVDCREENALCWPLEQDNHLIHRVDAAREWWARWDAEPSPWDDLLETVGPRIHSILGEESGYYGIDGGEWPPRSLLRFDRDDGVILLTMGMSLRPQPTVEMAFDDPSGHDRVELAMAVAPEVDEDTIMQLARMISGLSQFPWMVYAWLGHGHTLPSDTLEHLGLDHLFLDRDPLDTPPIEPGTFEGSSLQILWLIPIADGERRLAQDQGSEILRDRLRRFGVSGYFRPRAPTLLDG